MKPDLNAECMHSDKRRAIQHMDAKCPFTAPIQTQFPPPRGDAWHGGHCPAVNPGRGAGGNMPSPLSSFPLPHATLCYGIFWHVCICCMDLGNWRRWAVEGWQELPWRLSFLLMPHPLFLHGKARWHRDSGCWDLHWTSTPLEYLPKQSEFPERTSEKAGSSWCA